MNALQAARHHQEAVINTEDVFQRYADGDVDAFEEIYSRYHGIVRNIVWNSLAYQGDRRHWISLEQDVEDLVQIVFMKLHKHSREGSVSLAWLKVVAKHEALNLIRRYWSKSSNRSAMSLNHPRYWSSLRGALREQFIDVMRNSPSEADEDMDANTNRVLHLLDMVMTNEDGPEEQVDRAELSVVIQSRLRRLSFSHRSVLRSRYLFGLTEMEIAEELGIKPEAAKSRLARARVSLKKETLDYIDDEQ